MPSMCSAAGEAALCNTRNWVVFTEAALDLLVLFVRFVVKPRRLCFPALLLIWELFILTF